MAQFQTSDIPPDYRDDLTENEKKIIRNWVRNSQPFNNALRFGQNHDFFKDKPGYYDECLYQAEILSDVIKRSRLTDEYNVRRGLGAYEIRNVKEALLEHKRTGISPILYDEGFTAVSFQPGTALSFSIPDENDERYVLVSKVRRGDTALFIGNENMSHNRKQGEILLPAGTGYYIDQFIPGIDEFENIINFIVDIHD
jgi:hypothetical protein